MYPSFLFPIHTGPQVSRKIESFPGREDVPTPCRTRPAAFEWLLCAGVTERAGTWPSRAPSERRWRLAEAQRWTKRRHSQAVGRALRRRGPSSSERPTGGTKLPRRQREAGGSPQLQAEAERLLPSWRWARASPCTQSELGGLAPSTRSGDPIRVLPSCYGRTWTSVPTAGMWLSEVTSRTLLRGVLSRRLRPRGP